jgi:hypothetical protein
MHVRQAEELTMTVQTSPKLEVQLFCAPLGGTARHPTLRSVTGADRTAHEPRHLIKRNVVRGVIEAIAKGPFDLVKDCHLGRIAGPDEAIHSWRGRPHVLRLSQRPREWLRQAPAGQRISSFWRAVHDRSGRSSLVTKRWVTRWRDAERKLAQSRQ